MNRKKITVRKAIFIPFIIAILLSLTTFITVWQIDYNRLAIEQGGKLLSLSNQNTQQKLIELLDEPKNIAKIYNQGVKSLNESGIFNSAEIEKYTLDFIKVFKKEVPQISVIFYADENKNFIGHRNNGLDEDYSLMMQDDRTERKLNIYSGEMINTEIVASYEGYDPTQRPFYIPIKENPTNQWSDIYVNFDEINDATISILDPLFDSSGEFVGITAADVKLNGIHDFLKADESKGKGVIYIVDTEFNIVALSSDEPIISVEEIEGQDPVGKLLPAAESMDSRVRESAITFNDGEVYNEPIQLEINGERHFALISQMTEPSGLDWRIVAVIPESDLMGGIKERQQVTITIVVAVLLIGSIVGLVSLTRITSPIIEGTEMAKAVANGDWDAKIDMKKFSLRETDELILSLNKMTENLRDSFEAVTLNEAKYRELVESLDEIIYSLSPQGNIISINKEFEKFFSVKREDVFDITVNQFIKNTEIFEKWNSYFHEVLETKKTQKFQLRYFLLDKSERILNASLVPVLNDEGQINTILGSISDISELILALESISELKEKEKEKLEELVKQRTEELETATQEVINSEKLASLGSLVSGVSHEINTPLGVAVTTASYIEKISNENVELIENNKITKSGFIEFISNLKEGIKILNSNLYRASDLIKSFKMIAVNQSHENIEKFNFREYLDATITSLKHELKTGQHNVVIDCDSSIYIESYPGAYSQIITNLIMNSIIHGFDNRTDGTIKVVVSFTDDSLSIKYADDGVGIPKANIGSIYDPFYTSNRGKGGSGLGLNVVYNIVTGQLNGTINCISEIDKHTTFMIKIPLKNKK